MKHINPRVTCKHEIYTTDVNKKALSSNNGKRCVQDDTLSLELSID